MKYFPFNQLQDKLDQFTSMILFVIIVFGTYKAIKLFLKYDK